MQISDRVESAKAAANAARSGVVSGGCAAMEPLCHWHGSAQTELMSAAAEREEAPRILGASS